MWHGTTGTFTWQQLITGQRDGQTSTQTDTLTEDRRCGLHTDGGKGTGGGGMPVQSKRTRHTWDGRKLLAVDQTEEEQCEEGRGP